MNQPLNLWDIFTANGGSVGQLMRTLDWTTSSLGAPSTWPQPLQTMVGMMVRSKTPMFLSWGPELSLLYNDAYLDIVGQKHPAALGRPLPQVWPEIWSQIEPLIRRTLAGEAIFQENVPFEIKRAGLKEKTWFTFSYSPVSDQDGKITGVYCSLFETTSEVLAKNNRQAENLRLYSLFEQAPGFMAVLRGPDHVFELVNNGYLQLVGQRDLIGKPIREALPEFQGKGYIESLNTIYRSGAPYVGKGVMAEVHGESNLSQQRFLNVIVQPITDMEGRVGGILIAGHDVTDHVRVEEALKKSEQRALDAASMAETRRGQLDALLEAAPVGIAMVDIEGKAVHVNQANRQLWGSHPLSQNIEQYAEWKGWWADGSDKHGHKLGPDEWAQARALSGEVTRDIIEIEPFGEPNVRKTVLNCGAPIRNSDGNIVGSVVAQMDITDWMKTEAALRESEAKFRTIANAMPQMVWSTRPDGYHDYYNQRWYEFTGVPYGATDGEGWNNMFHPEDQQRAMAMWRHCLKNGEPYEIEYRLRHHSGEYRWTLGRALPIRDEHGTIIRWMGTCTDIHEQKQTEEALRQIDKRKDEFLAMLAHELRNPLAPISAAADLLSMASLDEERLRHLSAVIARQASHMTGLIDDLLDVSRVKRGLVRLDKSQVDIKEVVAEAIEQTLPLMTARSHTVELRLSPEHAVVAGDKKRLVQVLANLLSNAAKFTPNGGDILVREDVLDDQVIMSVSDSGIGMTTDMTRRAFELFSQGELSSDRSLGGLGIGLALVENLVRLHGGTASAQSSGPGLGSKFSVLLPRITQDNVPDKPSANGAVVISAEKGLRVLIVDDNRDAADTLAMYMQAAGHEVAVSYQSAKGIDTARALKPHACIIDIGLPEMDGNQLLRRLREIPEVSEATMVAMSGYGQPRDREVALAAGFDHYFVKPVEAKKLIGLLADLESDRHEMPRPSR